MSHTQSIPETNYITFSATVDNDPVELYPLQVALEPYIVYLYFFWWAVWLTVGLYMFGRYILIPLRVNYIQKSKENGG